MVPIADSHTDYLAFKVLDSGDNRLFDHLDLQRMQKGGVELLVFAVWVPAECEDTVSMGQKQIDCLVDLVECSKNQIKLCKSKNDMESKNCIKAILSIESGESIGCDAAQIQRVYDRGARMLSLTWNDENDFASGCGSFGGLKKKGKEAIAELNRLNVALDLSHMNDQGFWEALEIYEGVPCASHSCVYDIMQCTRNLKKEQIKYITESNGYIGINFYTEFLKGRSADIDDILNHIDYILELGGENAVGFGSDFCGMQYTPTGLDSAADFQKIPKAMRKRGYTNDMIYKICYGNFAEYILKFM